MNTQSAASASDQSAEPDLPRAGLSASRQREAFHGGIDLRPLAILPPLRLTGNTVAHSRRQDVPAHCRCFESAPQSHIWQRQQSLRLLAIVLNLHSNQHHEQIPPEIHRIGSSLFPSQSI
ncbi:hypothetical protein EV121DRAFT_260077 [Schizophyllum commune]